MLTHYSSKRGLFRSAEAHGLILKVGEGFFCPRVEIEMESMRSLRSRGWAGYAVESQKGRL